MTSASESENKDEDKKETTDTKEAKVVKEEPKLFDNQNYLDKNTLLLTASFLAIYFIIYAFLGLFYDGSDPLHHTKKAGLVDIVVFVLIIGIGVLYYYAQPPSKQETYWSDLLISIKSYFNNAYSILEVTLFIIFFYFGIYLFGIPMTSEEKPWSISFLESKAYILLFVLMFVQFFKYVLKIDIIGVIFGDVNLPVVAPIDASGNVTAISKSTTKKEEVFNISNNLYTYDDAKAVCQAIGSRLATYDEVEDSYNKGGEWSTYGWSDGQHAYFPTQKATWDKLQSVKGHEHDLGRPGINGGYFSNPNIRFGVNCYGVKPPMTDAEKALMAAKKDRVYPKNKDDVMLDAKVDFWKANKDKIMVLSGFNNDAWSRY